MPKKLISITLTFLVIISMVIPTFATAPYVNCSLSEGSKVTITWSLNQSRTIKIYRDGANFKTFNNTQNGSFEIQETVIGSHIYRAEAINPGGQDYKSDTITVTGGTGKPVIRLEFINKHGTSTSVERIYNWVRIFNLGSTNLDLSKMKIRYFYTVDGEPSAVNVNPVDPNRGQQKVEISDARINPNYSFNEDNQIKDVLIPNSVFMNFNRMVPAAKNNENLIVSDYYCDTYFKDLPSDGKIFCGYSIKLQPAFNKKNLTNEECNSGSGYIRNYNPQNDYSFDPTAADWKENKNICVYYDDELIWGNEPGVKLNAPTDLTASYNDSQNVELSWTGSQEAQSYIVYRSEDNNSNFIPIATGVVGTSFVDRDITTPTNPTAKSYFYKVVAVYNEARSSDSNIAEATISGIPLSAPTNLTAVLTNIKDVTLNWTASKDAQSYKVYRSLSSNGTYSEIAAGVTATTYADTAPAISESTGRKCYYKVVAFYNKIQSDDSNIADVTIFKYGSTKEWDWSYNIISKKNKTDFALGTYIPVAFRLHLKQDTNDPTINLVKELNNLEAKYVSKNDTTGSYLLKTLGVPNNKIKISNNSIEFNGDFTAGTIITVEFVLKVSPNNNALVDGINKYYNKLYNLNFTIQGNIDGETKTKSADDLGHPISLDVMIVKPDKLK